MRVTPLNRLPKRLKGGDPGAAALGSIRPA